MKRLSCLSLLVLLAACAPSRVALVSPTSTLPFSRSVTVGHTVYVSGHLGVDPATGVVPPDAETEVDLMLDRFGETLADSGVHWDDLVQVQVYCSDVSLYEMFNAKYRERFTGTFPSRAFVGSGKLLRNARFEIIGIATKS